MPKNHVSQHIIKPLAYSIPEAVVASGVGRSQLYEEIAAGRLPIVKVGRRTLIRSQALEDWLLRCERASTSTEA